MNPKHLHILQHSLGLDDYGRGKAYRNHYATEPGCDSYLDCVALVELGFMRDEGKIVIWGGLHAFVVTDSGKSAVREHSPKPPKLTRSQQRYKEFLESDSGWTFGEFLKWRWANRHKLTELGYTP